MKYQIEGKVTRAFYVYEYVADGTEVYVGIGTKGSDRHLAHVENARNVFLRRTLAKAKSLVIRVVYNSDERERVNQRERDLILEYGFRREGGTLCNVTEGGDGGVTHKGTKGFHNPKTGEVCFAHKCPRGWKAGVAPKVAPKIVAYNPETGKRIKIFHEKDLPEGFVLGAPKGIPSGPRGKVIHSNPKTGEFKWVTPDTQLEHGWVRGRFKGSVDGRKACFNPATRKKRFLKPGEKLPKGWRFGQPATTGKPVRVNGKRFSCIQAAVEHFGVARDTLKRNFNIKYLE